MRRLNGDDGAPSAAIRAPKWRSPARYIWAKATADHVISIEVCSPPRCSTPPTRPVQFENAGREWGPSYDKPCPCGSGVPAAGCHAARATGRWFLPPYTPLLTDAPTCYRHDRCYAGFTSDCSTRISKEHWLSAGILRLFGEGKTVRVGGLPWLKGPAQDVSIKNLSSNILCERHNSALARLDRTATQVSAVLDRYRLDHMRRPDMRESEFDLHSGEELERWLLKLIWGAGAANSQLAGNVQEREPPRV